MTQLKSRKFILAEWKGCDGTKHSGVYFIKDKPMLSKTLKKWKKEGKVCKFSIKNRSNFT